MSTGLRISLLVLFLTCSNLNGQNPGTSDLLFGTWAQGVLNREGKVEVNWGICGTYTNWIFFKDHTCTVEHDEGMPPGIVKSTVTWNYDSVTNVLMFSGSEPPEYSYEIIKLDSATLHIRRINLPDDALDVYGTAFKRVRTKQN